MPEVPPPRPKYEHPRLSLKPGAITIFLVAALLLWLLGRFVILPGMIE